MDRFPIDIETRRPSCSRMKTCPMHIQDGILSTGVCLTAAGISATALGYSLRRLRLEGSERVVPLTGMMSALIFAGQMVNFPLVGTAVSGHLMGGVLAASVLGPWAGCLAMTLVLTVQCLMFADGGLISLGVNVLHMAVVGSIGGFAVRETLRRWFANDGVGQVVGAVIASWLTVVAASALFCFEFAVSHWNGDYDFSRIFTLMVSMHSLIGIGEALITGIAIAFLWRHRPGLVSGNGLHLTTDGNEPDVSTAGLRTTLVAGMVLALTVAAFLAPWASEFPDGLEAVAEASGFDRLAAAAGLSLLDDYSIPAPDNRLQRTEAWQSISVSLAGVGGSLCVFIIAFVLGRQVVRPISGHPAG